MMEPQRATHHARGQFQSTPSVWRETGVDKSEKISCAISIHSLRVEGDHQRHEPAVCFSHFNPLPPCGGRPSDEMLFLYKIAE